MVSEFCKLGEHLCLTNHIVPTVAAAAAAMLPKTIPAIAPPDRPFTDIPQKELSS